MDQQEKVNSVRKLVAENQTRQAAETLCSQLEIVGGEARRSALVLLGRIKKLEDQVARNTISREDADLEHAKINEALLYLADEIAGGKSFNTKPSFSWKKIRLPLLAAGVLILAALAALPFFKKSSFDLLVTVRGTDGAADFIQNGQVKVGFGGSFREPKPLDANGQAIFEKNLSEYLDDTVKLVPINMKFKVIRQSAYTAAKNRNITFTLEPLPDTATLFGVVRFKDQTPVPQATLKLEVDGGFITGQTNGSGDFKILVPNKTDGDGAQMTVEYQGKIRTNRRVTFSKKAAIHVTLSPLEK